MRRTDACRNCGEVRGLAAHGSCFACYRAEQRSAQRNERQVDRHNPAIRREHKKLFKALSAVMGGLSDLGVGREDVMSIKRIYRHSMKATGSKDTMELTIDWTNLNCDSCGKRADHARLEDVGIGQEGIVLEAYCQDCMSYSVWVRRQRTAEELEIKDNTVGCRETCVICKTTFRPGMMCLWPFLRGTLKAVCTDCAEKAGLKYPFTSTEP